MILKYMISLEDFKKTLGDTEYLNESELEAIRDSLYELGHIIFDDWIENSVSSKYPVGVLQGFQERNKLKPWLTKDQKQG